MYLVQTRFATKSSLGQVSRPGAEWTFYSNADSVDGVLKELVHRNELVASGSYSVIAIQEIGEASAELLHKCGVYAL